ncbi:hypothetical protein GPECTOR_76g801 [Gonium pectorale]|uniref:Uncharacterized protein n=1 Tax=Gonium pectorale TaxID=33097 RepID=A0A150G282_GONPE|nr:hypothetical protein GPECTOR_76g801 [Gonium pectorale]|eukprot:KXZ43979.1 hypothetical protein GPECTOR_76g801 [Gonium pectorale]
MCSSKSSADVEVMKAMPRGDEFNRVLTSRVVTGCSDTAPNGNTWSATAPLTQSNSETLLLGWEEAADKYAREWLSVDLSKYRHKVYLMPLSIRHVSYGIGLFPMTNQPLHAGMTSTLGQPVHYSVAHSVRLGWTTPQAVLLAPDLPVGFDGYL